MNFCIDEHAIDLPDGCSDELWQKTFIKIKERIPSSKFKQVPSIAEYNSYFGTYHGRTQYQYYCDFINNILHNIRKGEEDYCFHIYQIAELLKYEHDNLKAE